MANDASMMGGTVRGELNGTCVCYRPEESLTAKLSAVLPKEVKVRLARSKDPVGVQVRRDDLVESEERRGPTTRVNTTVEPLFSTVRGRRARVAPTTPVVVDLNLSTRVSVVGRGRGRWGRRWWWWRGGRGCWRGRRWGRGRSWAGRAGRDPVLIVLNRALGGRRGCGRRDGGRSCSWCNGSIARSASLSALDELAFNHTHSIGVGFIGSSDFGSVRRSDLVSGG